MDLVVFFFVRFFLRFAQRWHSFTFHCPKHVYHNNTVQQKDDHCRDDPPHSIIDTQFEQQVEQESDDERVCLTAEESAGQESKLVEPQVTISAPDTEHHAQQDIFVHHQPGEEEDQDDGRS